MYAQPCIEATAARSTTLAALGIDGPTTEYYGLQHQSRHRHGNMAGGTLRRRPHRTHTGVTQRITPTVCRTAG